MGEEEIVKTADTKHKLPGAPDKRTAHISHWRKVNHWLLETKELQHEQRMKIGAIFMPSIRSVTTQEQMDFIRRMEREPQVQIVSRLH